MESWRERYLGIEAIPDSLTEAEIEIFFRLDPKAIAWSRAAVGR